MRPVLIVSQLVPVLFLLLVGCSSDVLTTIPPALFVTVDAIDFGEVRIGGAPASATLEVQNAAGAGLEVTVSLSDDAAAEGFSSDAPSGAKTLDRDVALPIEVSFAPTAEGAVEAVVQIASNDEEKPTVDVTLTGVGIAPTLCTDPLTIDFGDVQLATTAIRTVEVESCGDLEVQVSDAELSAASSAAFSLDALPFPQLLEFDTTATFEVHFAPTTEGEATGTVEVASDNLEGEITIELTGNGIPPPLCFELSPDPVDFGIIHPGETSQQLFELHNCGTVVQDLWALEIVNDTASVFSVLSSPAPVEIGVDESIFINLLFAPQVDGVYAATMNILEGTSTYDWVVADQVVLNGVAAGVCSPTLCAADPMPSDTWELAVDGGFDNVDGSSQPIDWVVSVEAPGTTTAAVMYDAEADSNVFEFHNTDSGGDGDWDRAYQVVDYDVTHCGSLAFEADGRAIAHNLDCGGWTVGEFPVHFKVFYRDATGSAYVWQHGLMATCTGTDNFPNESTLTTPDTWYHYVSPNLMSLVPRPARITQIQTGASGWSYHGRSDNISLIAGETICP